MILDFKGYNLNWLMLSTQSPQCCSIKERNNNSHRGIGIYKIADCGLLAAKKQIGITKTEGLEPESFQV